MYRRVRRGGLEQRFPTVFARRPVLASKNNHGSSRLAHVHMDCPADWYPKLKADISEMTVDSCQIHTELPIHTGSIHNKVLHYLTVIKLTVALFVGTEGFFISYSNGQLLIIYSVFVKYLRKNGNTMRQCISSL